MRSKKGRMSVGEQIRYTKTLSGVSYILVGIFEFFDNLPCQFLCIVFWVISLYLTYKVSSSKKENYDEMAEKNLIEAESFSLKRLQTLLCIIAVLLIAISVLFPSLSFSGQFLIPLLFVIIGVANLMVGIKFYKLEKE